MTDAEVRRPVRAWLWAGALLAASAAVPIALRAAAPGGYGLVGLIATSALFAASLVVFAFGLGGEGSVVGRRPGGVVALLVLAFVPPIVELALPQSVSPEQIAQLQVVWYIQIAVSAAAALGAVVAVGRAGVVPHPWRWAPAWGLLAIAVTQALPQVVGVAMQGRSVDEFMWLFTLGSLMILMVPLALGVIAMVLGARGLARPNPQIYPPAA